MMFDLIAHAAALILILASPHPWIGLIGGVLVYWAVHQRMHWVSKGWRWWW